MWQDLRATISQRMTLGAGTRLGPYEITAEIGAGGMGEMYRARQGRLTQDGRGHPYDVSADGRRFLINTIDDTSGAPITLVVNWIANLQR